MTIFASIARRFVESMFVNKVIDFGRVKKVSAIANCYQCHVYCNHMGAMITQWGRWSNAWRTTTKRAIYEIGEGKIALQPPVLRKCVECLITVFPKEQIKPFERCVLSGSKRNNSTAIYAVFYCCKYVLFKLKAVSKINPRQCASCHVLVCRHPLCDEAGILVLQHLIDPFDLR